MPSPDEPEREKRRQVLGLRGSLAVGVILGEEWEIGIRDGISGLHGCNVTGCKI